jgi:5-methyltetrahydrofolate--homocysteine methyltransferase
MLFLLAIVVQKIIGGCCGTAYEHIRAMKSALETTPLGNPPSDDLIVSKLGKFSENLNQTIDKNTHTASSNRSRRKRRST